jgi:hypothetical protein
MPPQTLLLILNAFQIAIQGAPQVIELVAGAKDYFATLLKGGQISKDVQDALSRRVDSISELAKLGLGSEFQVRPDPKP